MIENMHLLQNSVCYTLYHCHRNDEFYDYHRIWDVAFARFTDINDILDFYYEIIETGMRAHISQNYLRLRKKDKPWMTGHIRHLMMIRNRLNGVYNRTKKLEHKVERNRMRALVRKEIKIAKRRHDAGLRYTLENRSTDVKRFWSVMKQLFGNKVKAGIPTLIDNDTPFSTDSEKANLFADYFASQCSLPAPSPDYNLPPVTPITNARLNTVQFNVHDVSTIMSKLNVTKASGPDLISYRLLKECAHTLAEPFCRLFEKSFVDGIFPTKWKISHIAPVFKKALKHLKENYRPVSLLSCISKIMERVIFNTMYNFFKINGLLTERNSGFKEKDSTINQLIHLCHKIYQGLDNTRDVCLVFLDVSKAFDKVYHPALLIKLQNMGISGQLLRWIKSYLSDRKQRVVITGVASDLKDINASVPQGSILGPLLFLCYVNDLVDDLETMPYLFADDTSLFCEINPNDPPETFHMINRDLERLSNSAQTWRVQFNAAKTVYMVVSNKKQVPNYPDLYLHGQVLLRVNDHKHLGVTLNRSIKWDSYVDIITNKAATRLNGIK